MCSGSKRKPTQTRFVMDTDSQKQDGLCYNFSILLELTAADDLDGFRKAIEEEGHDIDEPGLWYGRIIGSRRMGLEERTPLMVASMFGSKDVASYVINSGCVDVNRACGSDGVTALHCATSGGSANSVEVVKLLLDASADVNTVDSYGNRPADLIAKNCTLRFNSRKKVLDALLKGGGCVEEINGGGSVEEINGLCDQMVDKMEQEQPEISTPQISKDGAEKKEYLADLTLPDIKNGIYGTDEFRMYTFKVKPCSRAYSHDWTECPFVHPGENARRRDPRKYHYSCVPCPEFRKGSCRQGDACEYAHGIFECWLHPAQYRTRLCKDETNCNRRVCFFAHKPEELRPLYASTGSAMPSPISFPVNGSSLDMLSLSPLALGSPSAVIPPKSTPPLTPSESSSPMGGTMWNHPNIVPPTLQLSGSRLKSARNARDMDYDKELLGLENRRGQQQFIDEILSISATSGWAAAAPFSPSANRPGESNRLGGVKPTNLDDIFGSLSPTILQGLSLDASGIQMRQNMNQQLRSSYPTSSSPMRASQSFGINPSGATAAAVLSSRSAAFAKRSQSFTEQNAFSHRSGFSSPVSTTAVMPSNLADWGSPDGKLPSNLADWGSPDGKLDWGVQREELNKLRKSASFGVRSNGGSVATSESSTPAAADEPDVAWVHSLVRDTPSVKSGQFGLEEQQCHINTGGSEMLPAWVEQLYMEQEQLVA